MAVFGHPHPERDPVRERVERRLGPRLELLKQRARLFAHILIFLAVMVFIHSIDPASNSILYTTETYTSAGPSYVDPISHLAVAIPSSTYTYSHLYPLVSLISWAWALLILLHVLTVWVGFQRERVIQREMANEMQLEKMRLQLELARLDQENAPDEDGEKLKRTVGLSDDGELLFDDTAENRPAYRRRARSGR